MRALTIDVRIADSHFCSLPEWELRRMPDLELAIIPHMSANLSLRGAVARIDPLRRLRDELLRCHARSQERHPEDEAQQQSRRKKYCSAKRSLETMPRHRPISSQATSSRISSL